MLYSLDHKVSFTLFVLISEQFPVMYFSNRRFIVNLHIFQNFVNITTYCNPTSVNKELKNILCLPFHPNFIPAVPILKTIDINLVFKYNNILRNKLIKISPPNSNNIVYSIPCKEYNKIYIGQTSKGLKVRRSQHKYTISRGLSNNGIVVHWLKTGHAMNWDKSTVIYKVNDHRKRNLLETVFIEATSIRNVNLHLGLSFVPVFLV